MDRDEAQQRMQEIQRIMERATLYTLLPGVPAIIGGVLALAGCAVSYLLCGSLDFADMLRLPWGKQVAFCWMWFAIGCGAVIQEVALTAHAAAKQGISPTARPGRFAAFSLTPSVVVAAVLTLKFLVEATPGSIRTIVPVWMMLYGTGVYTAGLFSVRPPRVLGMVFIASGAVSLLLYADYGVMTAALSFGLLHVLFGLYVIGRRRQKGETEEATEAQP